MFHLNLSGAIGFDGGDIISCGDGTECTVEYTMADRCVTYEGPACHYPCSTDNCTEMVRTRMCILLRGMLLTASLPSF